MTSRWKKFRYAKRKMSYYDKFRYNRNITNQRFTEPLNTSHIRQEWESDSLCNLHLTNDFNSNIDSDSADDSNINCNLDSLNFENDNATRTSNSMICADESVETSIVNTAGNKIEELRHLVLKHSLSHQATNDILKFVKYNFDDSFPVDARTLLNTPSTPVDYKILNDSQYYHFSFKKSLFNFLANLELNDIKCFNRLRVSGINLKINCDGIPLCKSTSAQFWPLSAIVSDTSNMNDAENPMLIGIYYGVKKPQDCQEYLSDFIDELEDMQLNKLAYKQFLFTVKVLNFICDAPARQFLKNITSHNGYFGCERCIQKGKFDRTVIYPNISSRLRTNSSFLNKENISHHKGEFALERVINAPVTSFVLDPMHLIYLGVVRKMLNLWLKGPLNIRLSVNVRKELSSSLINMANDFPCEITRKPRTLDETDRYKATEFKNFLLYSGVVSLCVLEESVYKNFLLLSCAVRLLSDNNITEDSIKLSRDMLRKFVVHFGTLYGERYLVYNVHNLVHICDDVENYGKLSNFSAFPFESFLGQLKNMLRKPNQPLQQIVNRIKEKEAVTLRCNNINIFKYPYTRKVHHDGPLCHCSKGIQYKEIYFPNYCLKCTTGDNIFMRNDHSVCKLLNIINNGQTCILIHKIFTYKHDFFTYPIPSSMLHIFNIAELSDEIYSSPIEEIYCKCMVLSTDEKNVCLPIIHTVTPRI